MIEFPWPHIVIDNLYDAELFTDAKSEIIKHVLAQRVSAPRQRYSTSDSDFTRIFPKTNKCLNSVNYMKFLDKFQNKRHYDSIKIFHEISFISNGYEYPIHYENEAKILSIVTYVAPIIGHGTLIYDENKNFIKEVEWKPNRTLFFAGITDKTWHNYKVDSGMPRITINTFLTNGEL